MIRVLVEPLADLDRIEFVAVIPWPPDPGSPGAEEVVDPEVPVFDDEGNLIPAPDAEESGEVGDDGEVSQ